MAIETQKNKIPSEMIAIWSITPNGKTLGQKLQKAFKTSALFVSDRVWGDLPTDKDIFLFKKLHKEIHTRFNKFSAHIFIFSTGIAVRMIAPLLNSKIVDPAVIVIDDNGKHAISLISGHLGGANLLAKKVAANINAAPVITTATDSNMLPAIDLIAKEKNIFIQTPENIKHISMAFLMGEIVTLYDPFELIKTDLPKRFWSEEKNTDKGTGNIFCSFEDKYVSRETLILRPPILSVGIGCNRGTRVEEIQQFLFEVMKTSGLSVHSIYRFATTNVKKDEKGMLSLSKTMKIPFDFYDNAALNSIKTIQTPSKMVEKHLGVKSVSEAAAILSADNGELIVPKKKNKDVTIAVAIKK